MWFSETCWHWHSLYRSMFSGSWRTSPVMWNAAGVSLMGGQHTASWVFCRGETGPISEGLRPHPCMLISPSEEPGSRAFAGVHCYGYSSSSHTILPEQVNQVEGILALAAQGYVTFGYVMHSQMSQKLQNEKAKVPIWLQTLLDLWKNSKQKSWEETRTLCWKTDTRTHKPPQKTRAQSQKHAGYGKRSLSSF